MLSYVDYNELAKHGLICKVSKRYRSLLKVIRPYLLLPAVSVENTAFYPSVNKAAFMFEKKFEVYTDAYNPHELNESLSELIVSLADELYLEVRGFLLEPSDFNSGSDVDDISSSVKKHFIDSCEHHL